MRFSLLLFTTLCLLSWPVIAGKVKPSPPSVSTQPLAALSETELNHWLHSLRHKSLLERLDKVSERALGTPYFLGPLGEGPQGRFDKKPLIDLRRVDCVTFCEQSLALALSPDYATAVKVLQKIRYEQGRIAMESRNHYFMTDWIPNNAWLVEDITPQLPGAEVLERTISHRQLFASQGFKGLQHVKPDRRVSKHYLPEERLESILPHLKTGDIGVLIQDAPGIFAAHTGLVIRKGDQLYLRNATSLPPRQVVDTPFETLIASLKKSKRLIGMSFARLRANPQLPH